MNRKNISAIILNTFLTFSWLNAQNSTIVGEVETYFTLNSIGIEWPMTGDENHNAACSVSYRIFGSGEYKQALPLFRIDFNGFNMMAGSILFLEPGTNYEIQLNLNDPDGGASTQNLTITTRKIPQMPVSGNIYYVSPGSGGGNGTETNPFLGMEIAQAAAAPGDVFLLNSGNYGGRFEFTASGTEGNYIVWKAASNASPKFDGVRVAWAIISGLKELRSRIRIMDCLRKVVKIHQE